MPLHLRPNPPSVRTLRAEESDRLAALYPDLPKTPKNCPTCRGKGRFLWLDEHRQPAEYECNCTEQWLLHRFFLASGIEIAYQRLSWDDAVAVPPALQAVILDYAERAEALVAHGRGLILHGKAMGTGKTLMAILLLKALLAKGYDGYFVPFNQMLNSYTDTWRDPDEARWFKKRIKNAGFLVVDDVGRENKGRMAITESLFDDVMRSRVAGARPTILTTNATIEEIRQGYGGNVMSLLTEQCDTYEVVGADYRPTARANTAEYIAKGLTRPLVVG